MVYSWITKPKFLLFLPLVLLLVVALACGEDDTPTPRPTATQVPATAVPQATSAPTSRPAATSRPEPTAVPIPTPLPPPTEIGPPTPTTPPVRDELEPIYGGIMPASVIADVDSWDPHRGRSLTGLSMNTIFHVGLLQYDPIRPGVVICDVCENFAASPDGLSFTFQIRQGVKFSDGTELTAEDAAFSARRWIDDEGVPRPNTATAKVYIDSVTVDGPYTMTIHNKAVAPAFLRNIARDYFKVLPKLWVEAGNDPHVHANTLGAGPFLPIEYKEAVSSTAEKNPNYFREGTPYLDGYTNFVLADPGTELAAYRTEKIFQAHHINQGIDSLNRIANDPEFLDNYDIWWQPGINGIHMIVNAEKPPFDNPKVREAINLALHRQPIIETIGGGRFSIGKPMGPNNPFALPDSEILQLPGFRELNGEKHPDDIARAKQLWAEVGFSASNPMVAEINAPDAKPHPDAAQVYKQQLEEVLVHVDITFRNMELGSWAQHMRTGPYDMSASGKGGGIADPDDRFAVIYLLGSRNWTRQEIAGVRELHQAQSAELDPAKRRELSEEMQRLVLNNFSGTMEMAWETQAILVHKKVMTKAGNYVLSAGRENAMMHYHEWLLPETPDRPSFGAD